MSISPELVKKIEKATKGDFITYEIDGRSYSGKIVAKDSDSFLILGRVEKSNGYGLLNDYVHNYGLAQAGQDIKEEFDVAAICSYVWHNQVKDVRYYADIKPGDHVTLEWVEAGKTLVQSYAPVCIEGSGRRTVTTKLIDWDNLNLAICLVPGIAQDNGTTGSKLRYLGVYQRAMPRLIANYQDDQNYFLTESQGHMVVSNLVAPSAKRLAFRYDPIVDFTPVATKENFDATPCDGEIKAGDRVVVRKRVAGSRYRIADSASEYRSCSTDQIVTVAAKFKDYIYVYVPNPAEYFSRNWDSYNFRGNLGSDHVLGTPGHQHIWCVRNAYWKKEVEEKKEPTPQQILADQKKAIKPGDLIEVQVEHISYGRRIADSAAACTRSSEKIYVEVAAVLGDRVYIFVPNPTDVKFEAGRAEHYSKPTLAVHPLFKTDEEHNRIWEIDNDYWTPAPPGAKLTYPAKLIEAKPIVEPPPAETDMKSSKKPAPKRIATARKVSSPTAHKDDKYMATPTPKKSIKDKLKKNLNDGMYMAAGEKGIRVMSDQLVKQLAKGDPARGLVAEMILKEPAAQALLKLLFGVGLDYVPKYGENPHLQQVADMLRTSGVRDGAVIGLDLLSTILTPAMEAALNSIPGMGTSAKETRVEETKARSTKRVGTLREVTADDEEEEEEEAKAPARRARSAS